MLTSCGSCAAALRGAFAIEVPVALRACAEQSPSAYLSPYRLLACFPNARPQQHRPCRFSWPSSERAARRSRRQRRCPPSHSCSSTSLAGVAPHNTLLGTQRCWTVNVKSGMCTFNGLPRWCLTVCNSGWPRHIPAAAFTVLIEIDLLALAEGRRHGSSRWGR